MRSPGTDDEVHAGQDRDVGVEGDAHAAALDDLVAQPGHGHLELHVPGPGRLGRPLPDQRLGCGDPGLRLAAAGLGTAPQPGQFAAGQVPPPVLGRGGLLLALGPGLEVGAVAALVEEVGTPVELEHAGGDAVEEVAVVGDDDQAAGVGGQPVLEPGHRGEVQVVGRLVEDQQFTGGCQDPGQRHPLGLSAGQFGDVAVDVGRHPEPVECGRRLPPGPDRVRRRCPGAARGVWSRKPVLTPRPWRTIPASGSSRPARTRRSVDLPVPLMPTTPSRSPLWTVTDRSPNRVRSAMVTLTPWRSTSTLTGHYGTARPRDPRPGGTPRGDADQPGMVTQPLTPAWDRWIVTLCGRVMMRSADVPIAERVRKGGPRGRRRLV